MNFHGTIEKPLQYKVSNRKKILLPAFSPSHGLGGGAGIYSHLDLWKHSESVLFSVEHLKKRKDKKFQKIKEKITAIADSGGYTYVSLDKLPVDYESVLQDQIRLNVDIGLTLDFPIDLRLDRETNLERMKISIANARKASYCLKEDGYKSDMKLFACVHGFDKKSIKYYVRELLRDSSDKESFRFDGFAIGSPIHSRGNFKEFIDIVITMLIDFEEYGELMKPVHILGTASPQKILPLVYIGVTSFDSAAPIFGGIFREYFSSDLKRQKIRSLERISCECPVCQEENTLQNMRENTSEAAAKIALHNFYMIKKFFNQMRESILEDEFDLFVKDFCSKAHYKHLTDYLNFVKELI
ncbi:MAG: tRNA-guanine transglycosylase [Theionarchaea archaeon]|nr:tRNA-guanine transglycosylase [Theionarchaea archaeon]